MNNVSLHIKCRESYVINKSLLSIKTRNERLSTSGKSFILPYLSKYLSFCKKLFFVLKLFSNRILLFIFKKFDHFTHFKVFSILNFGQFFTGRTIVAQPVSDDLCGEVKTGIPNRWASYYSWHCEEQWKVHNYRCTMTLGNSSKLLVELIILMSSSY